MKKASFYAICLIYGNGLGFYKTDGPGNWVNFDKDITSHICLRNMKKFCTYRCILNFNGPGLNFERSRVWEIESKKIKLAKFCSGHFGAKITVAESL